MSFKPGKSGNPQGRPKGSTNKVSNQFRNPIANFLNNNFERLQEDFEKLTSLERIKVYYGYILPYNTSRLRPVNGEPELDNLSDEQLDAMIKKLIDAANHADKHTHHAKR